MYTLHHCVSARSFRVLWMLEELGIPYRHETIAPAGGATRTDAFLALNPLAQVPVLDDHGIIVCESLAITLYLARSYGADVIIPPT